MASMFAGESMFHRISGASKVALRRLRGAVLREQRFALFDVQVLTGHLSLLGCIDVPRDDYRERGARRRLQRSARFA